MSNLIDLQPALEFLDQLQSNNRRDWFEANRPAYDRSMQMFEALVTQVIDDFRSVEDMGDLSAKSCIMRIYRDIRFSKDKSPYKTNLAASIAPGGKHSLKFAYYLHIAPRDGSFVAGGLHMPSSQQLARFRQQINRDSSRLKAIIHDPVFNSTFGGIAGEKLKTIPQGFSPDHPDIDLLRFKEAIVQFPLPDSAVTAPDLSDRIVRVFTVMKPFLDYLNDTVGVEPEHH